MAINKRDRFVDIDRDTFGGDFFLDHYAGNHEFATNGYLLEPGVKARSELSATFGGSNRSPPPGTLAPWTCLLRIPAFSFLCNARVLTPIARLLRRE